MPKLNHTPIKPGPEPSVEPCPDRGQVIQACRDMLELRRHAPDFAKAFVHHIAAPQSRYEAPHRVAVVGGGTRWEYPYRDRVLQSLDTFLRLSTEHQALLRAGIEEEGVPWRGEPIAQYLDTVNETKILRNDGIRAYIVRCKQAVKRLEAKLIDDGR